MKKSLLFPALMLLAGIWANADGLIVIDNPLHPVPGHFTFAPLAVTYHRVTVEIDGLVAVTSVDEEFFNPGNDRLEGTYVFPLPEGAHIDRFSMDINGKQMEAELLPADKARALYEEIVRKMRDPALLEYAGRGAFKVRVYPIEPRSKKRIRIAYTQLLKSDAGLVEYAYPLNTEKFSSAPLSEVSVKVTLKGTEPLKSVYSPSHDVEIRRDGDTRAVVGFEAKDVRPDTDFTVMFSRKPNPVGMDLVTSRQAGQDGYFMLLASPGLAAGNSAAMPKEVCFALDTSGSMAGKKLDQAKNALRQCLAGLNAADRFNIVRYSTEAERLFETPVAASKENIAKAEGFIDGLKATGGTALAEALALALDPKTGTGKNPSYVIFLTDGLPTVGETREDPIVEQAKKTAGSTRVFAFGVGTDVNTHLLDRVSGDTRGVSQYVLPGEDIEVKVGSFVSKIREPVLSNPTVSFTNPSIRVRELYPSRLPDLFNGDMMVVFGRYTGSGASAVRISGIVNGAAREFVSDVSFSAANTADDYIPRLWATRRVGWLLDEIRLRGESAELRDEVTRLAREFGIVTPYTAYLILEDEQRKNVPENLRSFQELERDRGAVDSAKESMDSVRREAASEASRFGKTAVGNAQAVQGLKDTLNLAQPASGAGMEKKAAAPLAPGEVQGYRASQTRNYAAQVRVLNGRAFYQNGNVWTDAAAQTKKNLKQKNIAFNSKEYFALLAEKPAAAQWLSLGNEMDIVVDDTLYSIRDK
jgi:Ca-activated chloride channel family protein